MPAPSSAAAQRAVVRAARDARRTARTARHNIEAIVGPVADAIANARSYEQARAAIVKAARRPTPAGLVPALDAILARSYAEGQASADGDG